MVFFEVAKVGDPSAEHLVEMIKAHRGYFNACDPLDGKEHSYIELGGWIGDQGLAFQLMGLGALLGLWKLLTPYTLLGDNADPNHVQAMAGAGFIVIQRMT